MPISPPSILLTAGDISGDVHTAALARALLARDPSRRLFVLGGKRLQEVVAQSPGGQFLGDTSHCSAIGIASAVGIYFKARTLARTLRRFLRTHPIDLAVLCDWGAFNGRMLAEMRTLGIPVLYYFPPRSWGRSGSQGLGIAPFVTRVATPFEWSAQRLRAVGCDAEWVGHPSLENLRTLEARDVLRQKFGVRPEEKLVALMPGSRRSEIRILAPIMAAAGALLQAERPVRLIAVVPREITAEARASLPASIQLVSECAPELLIAADGAIVKTGTASLEAVLSGTPAVAIYDVSLMVRLEWLLLWSWRRIPFLAMPNIILEREAVPEFIGPKARPEKIAEALSRLMRDGEARSAMLRDHELIRQALGSELPFSATERTAQIVEEMLAKKREPAAAP